MSDDGRLPPPSPVPPPASTGVPPPPPPGLTAPPGYVAFQRAPTPVGQLNLVNGLAKWVMIAAAVSGVVSVLSAIALVPVLDKAAGVLDGTVTDDEFDDAYLLSQLLSTLATVITLAAGIFTILWMYRIATNLRIFARRTTFAPVFAIVGWLLPPFLYVLPLLVLRELWKASDPHTTVGDEGWRAQPVNPLLYVWFMLYGVLATALGAVTAFTTIPTLFEGGFNVTDNTRVTAEIIDSSGLYTIASGVVTVVAAVVWVVFVKRLTARHVELTGET